MKRTTQPTVPQPDKLREAIVRGALAARVAQAFTDAPPSPEQLRAMVRQQVYCFASPANGLPAAVMAHVHAADISRLIVADDGRFDEALYDALVDLGAAAEMLEHRARERNSKKLAQLSRAVFAAIDAVALGDDPNALDGLDGWRRKRKAKPKLYAGAATPKERARDILAALHIFLATPRTRWQVAEYLAEVVPSTPAGPTGEALVTAIYRTMPLGSEPGIRAATDAMGKVKAEPFKEDEERTIVAAFKAAGMPATQADQLFRARR